MRPIDADALRQDIHTSYRVFADETPHCPNCGAKMDLKDGGAENE